MNAVSEFDTDLRILIVDDKEDDRDALATLLSLEGYEVTQAGTGEEARVLIEESNGWYDVVLLDESLPDINGITLVPEIKSQYPGIQIIMFTGQETDSGPEALALGVFRYKIKPVQAREIMLDLQFIGQTHMRQQAEILHKFAIESTAAVTQLSSLSDRILDWLREIVAYQRATVQLIQEEGTRRLLAYRGFSKEDIDYHLLRPITHDRLIARVVKDRVPLVLPHPQEDEDWIQTEKTSAVRSWIGVPLMFKDKAIGVLTLDHSVPGYFSRVKPETLSLFGQQAAAAISISAAQDEARRRMDEIETLNEVLRNISGQHQVEALLRTLMYNVVQQLDCDQISIFLPENEGNRTILRPKVQYGLDAETVEQLHFKPGEGVAGSVYQTGVSRLIPDTTTAPEFVFLNDHDKQPRSMLASPIKVHERTTGVICVDRTSYGAFSKEEQRWLDALAQQVGMAIEHRRFLDDFNAIGGLIISAHTVREVLTRIIAGAVTLTQCNSGSIYLFKQTHPTLEISEEDTVPYPSDYKPPKIRPDGLTRRIVDSGKRLAIKSTAHPVVQDRPDLTVNQELIALHVSSMVGIPLKAEKEVIGVFYINSNKPREFTEPEMAVLEVLAGQAALAIKQAYLKTAQIRTLHEIANRILDVPVRKAEKSILKAILDLTTELMGGAILGQIRLLNEEEDALVVAAYHAESGVKIHEEHRSLRIGEGVTGWVAEHQQSVIVPDVLTDSRYIGFVEGSRSELAVPMLKQTDNGPKVIGVLNIEHPQVDAFNEDDRSLAEAIASLAVVALENSTLIADNTLRVQELERILEVQEALAKAMQLPELLRMTLEKTIEVTKAACGAVQLLSEDQKALVLTVEKNLPLATIGEQKEVTDNAVGEAVRHRRIRNIGDVSALEEAAYYQPFSTGARSALIVPMLAGQQVIGVVVVEHSRPNSFDDHEVRAAKGLANHAAMAFINDYEREQSQVDQDVALLGIRRADWHHLIRQKAYSIDYYLKALRESWNGGRLAPDGQTKEDQITIEEALEGIAKVAGNLRNIESTIREDPKKALVADLHEIVTRTCPDDIQVTFNLECENTRLDLLASQFELAVEKLVDNAIEAMHQTWPGKLIVTARRIEDVVEIMIRDTGPGIPAHVRPYFLKSRPPDSPKGKGTGVLIARTIIHHYKGRLILVNSDQHGTELLIRLPVLKP